MKPDEQTIEMTETMDTIFDLCGMFGLIGENIRLQFQARNGDPLWEINEARGYLNQVEEAISDYEKMRRERDEK